MPKKPATISINLLPKDPFYETPLGKLLKWALSIGRYIVIFTELVVILSFVTRFSLDRQVTDLNDALFQKQTLIESYGDLEANVREAQAKIDQYQQISQQSNIAEIFPKLSAITPRDVTLDELVIKPGSVTLSGLTQSQNSLSLLINNIQLSPDFLSVSVDRIETGSTDQPGFFFRITAQTPTVAPEVTAPTSTPEPVDILDRTQGL
jgi:Tfp pilus assembly protein PilN